VPDVEPLEAHNGFRPPFQEVQVAGRTYRLVLNPRLHRLGDAEGMFVGDMQEIMLDDSEDTSIENTEVVLVHELLHAVLDSMGCGKLSKREKFVTGFSELWYQVIRQWVRGRLEQAALSAEEKGDT
jgi:hypothetical protein